MKIVLDTNGFVAGLLSPFGLCGGIIRMVSSGELALCLDSRVLTEYEEVLGRPKFKFEKDKVAAVLDYVEAHGLTSPLLLCRAHCRILTTSLSWKWPLPPAWRVSSQEIKIISRRSCAEAYRFSPRATF